MKTVNTFVCLAALVLAVGCGGVQVADDAIVIPDSPDGTVTAVAHHLAEGRPQVLWMALPPSYQQDINEVTHQFANTMDAELYGKVFTIAQKAVGVLTEKKQVFLESSMLEMAGDEKGNVASGWDAALGALGTVLHSEIADLEALKTMDWGTYLEGTGTTLMAQAAAASKTNPEDPYENKFRTKLNGTTVEVVSQDGDTATLKVSAPDEEPEEMQLVRVEGRWVPKDMADEWSDKISEAKTKLAEMTPETMAQGKAQAMMAFAMAEAFIDQVAQVNTSEELDSLLGGMFGGMMGGGMAEPGMDG